MKQQKGFTLIELVVVLVILGILAVVAAPKFIDLSDEAEAAALKGVVGAINSASAIHYGGVKAGDLDALTRIFDDTDSCETVIAKILVENAVPDGYSADNTALPAEVDGNIVTCTITQDSTSDTAPSKIVWVE